MIAAEVSYINADAEIVTDYNSKNKLLTDTTTVSEVISTTTVYSRVFTDSITIVDTPDIGQIHKENPAHSVSIGDALAIQFNLSLTDSISSSETFVWTVSKNLTESISTGDTPGIGQIHHVNPTDSVAVSDLLVTYHDGMLNTNMLNTRLISTGDLEVLVSNVSVTLS
jgi:hypothetical protein